MVLRSLPLFRLHSAGHRSIYAGAFRLLRSISRMLSDNIGITFRDEPAALAGDAAVGDDVFASGRRC